MKLKEKEQRAKNNKQDGQKTSQQQLPLEGGGEL